MIAFVLVSLCSSSLGSTQSVEAEVSEQVSADEIGAQRGDMATLNQNTLVGEVLQVDFMKASGYTS